MVIPRSPMAADEDIPYQAWLDYELERTRREPAMPEPESLNYLAYFLATTATTMPIAIESDGNPSRYDTGRWHALLWGLNNGWLVYLECVDTTLWFQFTDTAKRVSRVLWSMRAIHDPPFWRYPPQINWDYLAF